MTFTPHFTDRQIEETTANMPRTATEAVAAACIPGMTVRTLASLRLAGHGPAHSTRVNGATIYGRTDVLHWMHEHREAPDTKKAGPRTAGL